MKKKKKKKFINIKSRIHTHYSLQLPPGSSISSAEVNAKIPDLFRFSLLPFVLDIKNFNT